MTRIKTWALAVVAGLLMASGLGWSASAPMANASDHTRSPSRGDASP